MKRGLTANGSLKLELLKSDLTWRPQISLMNSYLPLAECTC
ncbi:hypothetical protein HNQ75_003934 [Rhizobium flavum]|uniref:Uncharacterized protein n=1 Tax=Pseudorhizobium flavum TaxID=1335061 RepID=A0A7W9Z3M7_9HYPH|nr:hypothetical protein [Pseudorhizobium flavum]CAD6628690.1 hypothetical protein RFYW14_04015 [Pseudorhizobium flavum]